MPATPRPCLTLEEVLALVADPSAASVDAAMEAHLDTCGICRTWVAEVVRISRVEDPADDDGAPAVPIGEFLPPRTAVGRYVLEQPLGAGGMGVVYAASDPSLRRRVAIKVLRAAIADTERRRLVAEARAMAGLSHPNVRAVFDLGEVDGRAYVAMELVEGPTLGQWLAFRERTTTEIVTVLVAAARGLAAAHAIGIVHRDFKPANVFVGTDGRVRVGDFGLATWRGAPTLPTGGTPRYMAPEQHDGAGDTRVDQYAFGRVLAEALAGRRVPRRVRRVVERTTRVEPERRFASMDAVVVALAPTRRRAAWLAGLGGAAVLAAAVPAVAGGSHALVPVPTEPPLARGDHDYDPELYRLDSLSRAVLRSGDYTRALEVAQWVVEIAEARDDAGGRAMGLYSRASAYERLGRPDLADRDFEQGYLVAVACGRPGLAADIAIARISLLAEALGRHEEAIAWGRHAQASLDRSDSGARYRARLALALGTAHARRAEWAASIEQVTIAVDHARAAGPDESWLLAVALSNRGYFVGETGDLEASERDLTEAVAVATEHFGEGHVELVRIQVNLANTFKKRGESARARRLFETARRGLQDEYGADAPLLAPVLVGLGATWVDDGEPERALPVLRRAIELFAPDDPNALHAHHDLAVALRDLDRCDEAMVEATAAIDHVHRVLGPEHPAAVPSGLLQVECRIRRGELERAASTLDEVTRWLPEGASAERDEVGKLRAEILAAGPAAGDPRD